MGTIHNGLVPQPEDLTAPVHVIPLRLRAALESVEAALSLLSSDERARADRFHGDELRNRYILGRACLRLLLGRWTGIAASQIRFAYGSADKPSLAWPPSTLGFNVSHCEDLAVIGAFHAGEIGVDLERVRTLSDRQAVAQRFFSAGEYSDLMAYPPQERTAAFFRCWVRKEAYLKALGGGLSIDLASFRVSLGERAELLASDRGDVGRWTVAGFQASPEHVGAVVYEGAERALFVHEPAEAGDLLRGQAAGTLLLS